MRELMLYLFATALIAGSIGCQKTGPLSPEAQPSQDFEITTDERIYSLTRSEQIRISAVNASSAVLYQAWPSLSTVLERKRGDDWKELGTWYYVAAVGPFPTEIAPEDSAIVPNYLRTDSNIIDSTGRYRIKMEIYKGKDLDHLLPKQERVSNVFRVVE